jgi:hypothetical protein
MRERWAPAAAERSCAELAAVEPGTEALPAAAQWFAAAVEAVEAQAASGAVEAAALPASSASALLGRRGL